MSLLKIAAISSALVFTACAVTPHPVSQTSKLTGKPAQAGAANAGTALTPVAKHGALSVEGRHIVGQSGAPASLAGPSFFWSNSGWGQERFYNQEAVKYFASDWKASIVRAAIGAQSSGSYLTDPKANLKRAFAVIDGAIEAGIYVIVDWHSHEAEAHPEAAEAFFTAIATRYGNTPNVIYEIYNEPLKETDWENDIKPYAKRLIKVIRDIDPDNIIVVGTQSWSQDVDKAAASPITGEANIAYTLHYYAASHKGQLRARAKKAIRNGLPIMITEWGSVNYDGDGKVDKASSRAWLKFAKENGLSHMVWAVSDKEEGASMFKPGAPSKGGWTDKHLTEAGLFARSLIREWDAP